MASLYRSLPQATHSWSRSEADPSMERSASCITNSLSCNGVKKGMNWKARSPEAPSTISWNCQLDIGLDIRLDIHSCKVLDSGIKFRIAEQSDRFGHSILTNCDWIFSRCWHHIVGIIGHIQRAPLSSNGLNGVVTLYPSPPESTSLCEEVEGDL